MIASPLRVLAVALLITALPASRASMHSAEQAASSQKSRPAPKTNRFTAKLTCPIPSASTPSVAQAVMWPVGPTPCDPKSLGEACRSLVMTQERCSWEGMTLGGQVLTESLMHGQGYLDGTTGKATTGYDWGTVSSGDSYLSRWTETMDFAAKKISGTWTLVLGTGALKGITGRATIQCAVPAPTDTVEVCTVSGSYRLAR